MCDKPQLPQVPVGEAVPGKMGRGKGWRRQRPLSAYSYCLSSNEESWLHKASRDTIELNHANWKSRHFNFGSQMYHHTGVGHILSTRYVIDKWLLFGGKAGQITATVLEVHLFL